MKRIVAVFAVTLFIAAVLCSCKKDSGSDIASPLYDFSENAFETAAAEIGAVEDILNVRGSIGYYNVDVIRFGGSGGVLTSLYCKPGDRLLAGDVIAVITDSELNNRYSSMKNSVELARLRVESLKESGADSFDVSDATADYEIEKIKLSQIEDELSDYTLKAPFNCVVQNVLDVKEGDSVSADSPICVVADTSSLCLYYGGDGLDNFRFGQDITVTCGGNWAVGRVISAPCDAPSGGGSSARYAVFSVDADLNTWVDVNKPAASIDLAKEQELTVPTLISYADIKLVKDSRSDVLTVPSNAVLYKGERPFVNVYRDGNKIQTFVEIGLSAASKTEIVGGISEGDLVILNTAK